MQAFIFLFFLKMCVHGRWKVYVTVSNTVAHIADDPTSSSNPSSEKLSSGGAIRDAYH